jgi:hypothetical protein
MDKQQLVDRITVIKQEMEVMKGNYAKLEGHLNECTHWLQVLVSFEQQLEDANDKLSNVCMDSGVEENGEINGETAQQAA